MRRDVAEQGTENRLQQPGDPFGGAASARNDGANLQLRARFVCFDLVMEGGQARAAGDKASLAAPRNVSLPADGLLSLCSWSSFQS